MKRREFGGLVVTAIAGLFVSGVALASGKKTQTTTSAVEADTATSPASSVYGPNNTPFNPNSFYVTIVTLFPYKMAFAEYKSLVKNCRNVEATDKLLVDMKAKGKIVNIQSLAEADKVTSCFEFRDEKAFKEYEARYALIPGNFPEIKKKLGFKTKIEFSRTVIS